MEHATWDELDAGLEDVRSAPAEEGTLEMIVRRPAVDEREVLEAAKLDLEEGLVGDSWRRRGSSRTGDGSAHPDMQLNLMNARAIALLAGSRERWPLAGDQLYVDLDLSAENLPPGTRLTVGEAEVEITAQPHTGCVKFKRRFGMEAVRWVNSPTGRALNLRGVCAKVVRPGTVRPGDRVTKSESDRDEGVIPP